MKNCCLFSLLLLAPTLLALAQEQEPASTPPAPAKPPASGELYSFLGTMALNDLRPANGATVSIGNLPADQRPAIKLDFPVTKGYPGVHFPIPKGGWDLSDSAGLQIEVTNPGERLVSVYLRADNEGDPATEPWNTQVVRVEPGKTETLQLQFGQNFGQVGFKLNPRKITSILVFADPPSEAFSVLLNNLKVYGKPGAATTDEKSAKPEKYEVAGASKPYLTTTTSPKNHAVPYGMDFELVKDWTFGKNRADATVRNRAELDADFYYRYIYEGGKLDTLSTYWTVHRDYPDDDPKNLHVFGDNTLTLKARVREGEVGGLKKGGLESGMLRAKIPVTTGMYMEMRAKLTRGIGAWPAFWLGCGVQYPDNTFSELPWPPEIDILEFFNWQGREDTRFLVSNIQTNKNPKKFGNPYTIFSAFNKADEYVPGMDFSQDFHVFALDWQEHRPIWYLDGHPIKQSYYEWNGPPAHLLITNQLGIQFGDMKEMKVNEANWDYVIDYIRIWKRKTD